MLVVDTPRTSIFMRFDGQRSVEALSRNFDKMSLVVFVVLRRQTGNLQKLAMKIHPKVFVYTDQANDPISTDNFLCF
jgi:hypothetical protein